MKSLQLITLIVILYASFSSSAPAQPRKVIRKPPVTNVARATTTTKNTPLQNTQNNSSDNSNGLLVRLKVGFYFAAWYFLNVVYNILNKKVLNILPTPITIGTIQLGIGALYSILLWILRLRPTPKLNKAGRSMTSRVGIYHSSGQLLSMISLSSGPVSFTHIVKALEPFFSACVSALVFGKWMKWQVYVTLLPVVGGVSYACFKERGFSYLAFWSAMISNLAFALRAAVSKLAMESRDSIGTNLTSTNVYSIVTIWAFALSIPLIPVMEGSSLLSHWTNAIKSGDHSVQSLTQAVVISGLFHYLNNEVMYLALSNVHPVTLAVGNTMKRVFIILASVIVFRNPVSLQTAVGSAIGIGGVLLYSLTKQYYENLEQKE